MNQVKLKTFINEQKCVIPLYFLRMCEGFNLNTLELTILIYLYDKDKVIFNPSKIAEDLNIDLMKIMESISSLEDKGLMKISTVKNENGVMEEVTDLSLLFDKITLNIIEELNTKEESELNIHSIIENEFNRKLTPLEHEMIDDWDKNNYDKELVREAVKEASINGVSNLRYIDKILLEWNKKGYQKPSDIKKEVNEVKKDVEVFNCDWLNDDEEI